MGKTLLQLLEAWPTPDKLNPNSQKAGMLKPEPDNKFTNDNKQALDFVKATPRIYGTDIVRITTRTDPHETKKAIKKGADKVGGALAGLGGVGLLVGGAISAVAAFHPKFPDDWTVGEDGSPTGMEKNFYKGLINGDYAFGKRYNPYHNNNKTKLGNFLTGNKTPDQAANAIVPSLKSAAVGLAVVGIGLGLSKLFSKGKKKGKSGPAPVKPKVKPATGFATIDKNKIPFFPSSLVINSGFKDGVSYRNYSRLRAHKMKITGMDYLKSSSDEIIQYLSPTIDSSKIPSVGKDSEHTLSDYYSSVYANNTPQTTNLGNVIVSANMVKNSFPIFARLENIDTKNNTGKYQQIKKKDASGRALDDRVQNYSKLVDKDGNAYTYPGPKDADGFQQDNLIDKGASLSQIYGAPDSPINLIKIVKGDNDYTFDISTDDGSSNFIGNMKGGEEYEYTKSELKINTLTTDEQSRFIDGGIADLGESKLIKGMGAQNVETQVGQLFGNAFIAVDIDTKKPEEYKYPFRTIGQMDTVARWNTKDAKFSDNVKTITDNDTNFLNTALQTQNNTSLNINPYLHKKRDVLKDNAEDGVIKVSIYGINFISTISNLSDKSAASWDSVKPIGSGVNFYLYNSWERDISFDLKLYADNKSQLDQIWKKVNAVTALTRGKPTDSKKGVFGRIVGLEIGDLISVEGFVSDISMNVDDATPWEITKGSQAPMICSISVSFKVVTNGDAGGYTFYNTLKA
jgi:hypothetical protein